MKAEDRKILDTALARFERAYESEREMRELAEDDLLFVAGDQWPDDVVQARGSERPSLVINRLPALIHQAVSAARRSNMAVSVSPAEDGDTDVADIYAGLIRHIERQSHADQAYDTGFQMAAECGIGYWRVNTEYADHASFDQAIRIERILNPFSVYSDPDSDRYDGSDARWYFVSDYARREDLEEQYPEHKNEISGFSSSDDEWSQNWIEQDRLRIVEYWERVPEEYTLAALSTGETIELESGDRELLAEEGIEIIKERKGTRYKVVWRKLCGACVLEGPQDWPSEYLPIVPIRGPEYLHEGKIFYRSLIRAAKDPMRMYNYWQSAITEKIALAPKSPWLVTPRMVQGMERLWESANVENRAYLPYNPDGALLPQRQQPAAMNPAEIAQSAQSIEDIRATTGIYEASTGEQGPEESGIALMARTQQGNEATFPWIDNLRRSIEHTGRILVDMIPRLYDTPRTIRILGEDGAEKIKKINQVDLATGQILDITQGRFDVAVSTGPSYATQRAAAAAILTQMMRLPEIAPIAAHMLAEMMDVPHARKLGKYLKRMLPPNILDEDDPDRPQQIPQQGPDPTQILAQAELMKAQAAMARAQSDGNRTRLDAAKTMAQINSDRAETEGQNLDNAKAALELAIGRGALEQIVEARVRETIARMSQPMPYQ